MSQLSLFDQPPSSPKPVPPVIDLSPVVRGRPEVVYRNPANEWQTWTGRGKPPRWVAEWIESGKSLDALRVSGTK
jgi:hypothetical protein